MSRSLARVERTLAELGLPVRVIEAGACRTAEEAAASVGCAVDQIAKSIIFRAEGAAEAGQDDAGHLVLFLTAGGNRVDPARASAVAGQRLGKADAALIRAETGFAIGGVAPVGHLVPIRVFWDKRLDDFDVIWAAAGTPRHVFAAAPADLRRVTGAEMAEFTA